MLVYDDIYTWEGWGGRLRLASGKCRLRLFDRRKTADRPVTILRPMVAVVSDVPDSKMSVRSCAGHIATRMVRDFDLDPQRMLYVEYYPAICYGLNNEHEIPEQYVAVDFTWSEGRALHPRWRPLKSPLLDIVKTLMESPR